MTLPSQLALGITGSSPGLYLQWVKDGYLEYCAKISSPSAKFEIEKAKCGGGLVHIRCCYNNKYWVRSSASGLWIVVTAKVAQEDKSAWNCTLFKPILDNNKSQVRFVHVQTGSDVRLSNMKRLTINPQDAHIAVSRVVDFETVVFLPHRVAFLGDNDKYLKAFTTAHHDHFQFGELDLGSQYVPLEVYPNNDGDICIKSTFYKKFWRTGSATLITDYITAESNNSSNDNKIMLYRPIKVGPDTIVLRALSNNKLLQRVSNELYEDCVAARAPSTIKETHLRVVEPILESTVTGIEYRLSQARIYGLTPLVMATQVGKNGTNTTNSMTLNFGYTDTTSSTISNSISVKAGVKTTFETGIPFIAEGHIEVSVEAEYTHEWGHTTTVEKNTSASYTTTVPPRTKCTVSLMATQGHCNVPFAYTQTDLLTNGERVTRTLVDGVFNGVNNFNFHFETKEEPLPRSEWV